MFQLKGTARAEGLSGSRPGVFKAQLQGGPCVWKWVSSRRSLGAEGTEVWGVELGRVGRGPQRALKVTVLALSPV